MCILRKYVPYTTLRVLYITLVTGNDVNMSMQDTLAGRRPYVNADIVTIGLKFLIQQLAFLGYQLHAGSDLFGCQVKKAGNMALWHHDCMARAHRVAVTCAIRKFVIQGPTFWACTKQTWIIGVSLFFLFFF